MTLTDKINDGFKQLATLLKGKVDKTATIGIANGGTGATTLAGAQTALGIVDNSSLLPLLPQKIGSAQKWYQKGLRHGADVSSDTLKELADKIAALAQADNGLVSASQLQAFTEQQKAQARTNIDVYSKAEIGDIDTNFVTTINTVYNS